MDRNRIEKDGLEGVSVAKLLMGFEDDVTANRGPLPTGKNKNNKKVAPAAIANSSTRWSRICGWFPGKLRLVQEAKKKLSKKFHAFIKKISPYLFYIAPVTLLVFIFLFIWLYLSEHLMVTMKVSAIISGSVVLVIAVGYLIHSYVRGFIMIFGPEIVLKICRFAVIRILVFLSPLYMFQLNLISLGDYAVCTTSEVFYQVQGVPRVLFDEMKNSAKAGIKGIIEASEAIRSQVNGAQNIVREVENALDSIKNARANCNNAFSKADGACNGFFSFSSKICNVAGGIVGSVLGKSKVDCSGVERNCRAFKSMRVCEGFSVFDHMNGKLSEFRRIGLGSVEQLFSLDYNARHYFNASTTDHKDVITTFKDGITDKLYFLFYLDIVLTVLFTASTVKLILSKISTVKKYHLGKLKPSKPPSVALRLLMSPFFFHVFLMCFSFAGNAIVKTLMEIFKHAWEENPMATFTEIDIQVQQSDSFLQKIIDGLLHDTSISISKSFKTLIDFDSCWPTLYQIPIWHLVTFVTLCILGHLSYRIDDYFIRKQRLILDWIIKRNKSSPTKHFQRT